MSQSFDCSYTYIHIYIIYIRINLKVWKGHSVYRLLLNEGYKSVLVGLEIVYQSVRSCH